MGKRMIRVLQIGRSTEAGAFGGVEKFLLDLYRYVDKDKFVFDFVFCSKNPFEYISQDDLFKNSKITAFSVLKDRGNSIKNYLNLRGELIKVLNATKYDIVHINSGSMPTEVVCLNAIKSNNIKVIAHSHSTKPKILNSSLKSRIKNSLSPFFRLYICRTSDYLFACSIAAGEHLFGRQAIKKKSFHMICNAVNAEKFRFDPQRRIAVRNTFLENVNIQVFGYVGRLSKDKNILFILDVFKAIHECNEKSELWLIGDGEEKEGLQRKISEYGLTSFVKLLGQRNDVATLMQGADCFIMPSLDEGLSLTIIEAQAAGLPVFAYDSLSREHAITRLMRFVPFGADGHTYASCVLNDLKYMPERYDTYQEIVDKGYEINSAVKKMEVLYLNLLRK